MASTASSCELKQIALPVNVLIEGSTPPTLITAPLGARLPNKIDKPPSLSYGFSSEWITSKFLISLPSLFSRKVFPVTVILSGCKVPSFSLIH